VNHEEASEAKYESSDIKQCSKFSNSVSF